MRGRVNYMPCVSHVMRGSVNYMPCVSHVMRGSVNYMPCVSHVMRGRVNYVPCITCDTLGLVALSALVRRWTSGCPDLDLPRDQLVNARLSACGPNYGGIASARRGLGNAARLVNDFTCPREGGSATK